MCQNIMLCLRASCVVSGHHRMSLGIIWCLLTSCPLDARIWLIVHCARQKNVPVLPFSMSQLYYKEVPRWWWCKSHYIILYAISIIYICMEKGKLFPLFSLYCWLPTDKAYLHISWHFLLWRFSKGVECCLYVKLVQDKYKCSKQILSLIHIWRCRRIERCRSRWSPYH